MSSGDSSDQRVLAKTLVDGQTIAALCSMKLGMEMDKEKEQMISGVIHQIDSYATIGNKENVCPIPVSILTDEYNRRDSNLSIKSNQNQKMIEGRREEQKKLKQ